VFSRERQRVSKDVRKLHGFGSALTIMQAPPPITDRSRNRHRRAAGPGSVLGARMIRGRPSTRKGASRRRLRR